ncbi:FHA domain-containing protein [Cellulomonas sp. P22]|uniref:FHA domain-containing protein n=1 Tax=Cellulomonas sp. P22 TaxID=3373189 RepID=UPI0037BA895C
MTSTAQGAVCAGCRRPLQPGARFCTGCGSAVVLAGSDVVVIEDAQPAAPHSEPWGAARRTGTAHAPSPTDERAASLDPAFGGVTPARVGQRLLAYAVDALAVTLACALVLVLTRSVVLTVLVGAELVVGIVVWEGRTGASFGNLAVGLRTARIESPHAAGSGRSTRRALVLGAGHLGLGVGQWLVVASGAFDPTGRVRGWHDRAARTVVVDVRAPRRSPAPPPAPRAVSGPAVSTVRPAQPRTPEPPTTSAVTQAQPRLRPDAAGHVAAGGRPGAPVGQRVPAGQGVPVDRGVPVAPPREVAAVSAAPAAGFVLTLDTGESTTVHGPGVVGRAPRAVPGERCDHVVQVDDPDRSLSRTHARFGIDSTGFWISDAGSGNGTVLLVPGRPTVVVPTDRRVSVPAGATVQIGNRTFTVRPATR